MRKLSFLSALCHASRSPQRGHGARRARHGRVRWALAPPSTTPPQVQSVLSWCCFLRVALATRLCGSLPHRLCGMVVQQEVVLAVLWMGSIHWLLCNVLHLLHMVCSSMALHSTSIWRVLLQFRKLSHLELATPCSCHRSSEGHLQRLTAPRGTPTASVAALELASRTPATLLARAPHRPRSARHVSETDGGEPLSLATTVKGPPRMVERQR